MIKAFWKTASQGSCLSFVPTSGHVLDLSTLFTALDGVVGRYMLDPIPGLGLLLLVVLFVVVGLLGDHVIGQGSLVSNTALNRSRSCRALSHIERDDRCFKLTVSFWPQ